MSAEVSVADMQAEVVACKRAALGDSNDAEIETLQGALEMALTRWPEVNANPEVDEDEEDQ